MWCTSIIFRFQGKREKQRDRDRETEREKDLVSRWGEISGYGRLKREMAREVDSKIWCKIWWKAGAGISK